MTPQFLKQMKIAKEILSAIQVVLSAAILTLTVITIKAEYDAKKGLIENEKFNITNR
ncbi:MAG: hypothetical protein RR564_03590 [Eubacterium sp.]